MKRLFTTNVSFLDKYKKLAIKVKKIVDFLQMLFTDRNNGSKGVSLETIREH